MRLHVVGLPHTQTTAEFNHCAYTAKVRKFSTMMHDAGFDVTLYAGDENEARCLELVACTRRGQQEIMLRRHEWYREGAIYGVSWDPSEDYWQVFNRRLIKSLRDRVQERDVICLPTGLPMREVIDAFPNHLVVESGVGYEGTCSNYRVFESYAWMHALYGMQQGAGGADGRFFDAVIPNFFDPVEFPESHEHDGYFLFMSRMTHRKGYQIAIDATRELGAELVVAGVGGDRPDEPHVRYVGFADTAFRGELMSRARAVFVPTLYLEPFGGVAVEAMMCGTPVITTDWGAFTETVGQDIDGYRCRTMSEFIAAGNAVDYLDRRLIRKRAHRRYSMSIVAGEYRAFFDRLQTLWDEGFYSRPGLLAGR